MVNQIIRDNHKFPHYIVGKSSISTPVLRANGFTVIPCPPRLILGERSGSPRVSAVAPASHHIGLGSKKSKKKSWGFWLVKDISNSQINVILWYLWVRQFQGYRILRRTCTDFWGARRQDLQRWSSGSQGALMVAVGCCCYLLLLFPKSIIFQVARDIKGSFDQGVKRCWFHAGNPDEGQAARLVHCPRFSQVSRTPLGPTIGYPSWSSSGFVWTWGTPK